MRLNFSGITPRIVGLIIAGALTLSMHAAPAHAELGGDAASNTNDSPVTSSTSSGVNGILRQMQRGDGYDVRQSQLPTGTVVREYIAPNGKIFAVAWEGPVLPDLQQLLGNYFPQYLEAARSGKAGRGALAIAQPNLVVQSAGRMRAFFGKAYDPQLLPQGVGADVIQ